MIGVSNEQFDMIERECGVRFDAERRRAINQTIKYWSGALTQKRVRGSKLAPGRTDREGKRKRRLGLVRELALHYEIVGGRPEQQRNWDRGEVDPKGFPRFLELIHPALPSHVRPTAVETFIRDAEHLGFSKALHRDSRGGSTARAAYMLRTMTAWRSSD